MSNLKSFIFYCFVGLTLCNANTKAVEVKDLYLVKWPVEEQSKSARWKAALAGFKEVLIRKSGSQSILQSYEVQQAYPKVISYLQSFEYTRQEAEEAQDKQFPYLISLYFEPRLIDNLIKDSKMTLWGANRPVTILWIAVEDNFKRRILKDETQVAGQGDKNQIGTKTLDNDLSLSISENAIRRGLPIISPLMDLEDELLVSISDIWGRFPSTILQASQRYSADSVLLGRVKQQGELWLGEFTYLNQEMQSSFKVSANKPQKVIGNMVDKLAELLCNNYCVIEEVGQKNEVLMNLSGINNYKKFKAAEEYLNNLSAIKLADVNKIDQHNVIFKLTLLGQLESLIGDITLSQKMQVDVNAKESNENSTNQKDNLTDKDFEGQVFKEQEQLIEALLSNPNQEPVYTPEQTSQSQETDNLDVIEPKKILTLYYRWLG